MSLALTYHNQRFGIVCSDGRVSMTLADGRRVAVPQETVRKFVVLRADPGLVLAGSSSISRFLDFSIYEAMRRRIEVFPEATFDQVGATIGPTVYEARTEFGIFAGVNPRAIVLRPWLNQARKSAGRIYRFAAGKFLRAPSTRPKFRDGIDGNFLNLLGFDRHAGVVRNRVFSCTDRCDQFAQQSGVTISGDMDSEEAWILAGELLELIGSENTSPQAIVSAMLSLMPKISALHPETIGPPHY